MQSFFNHITMDIYLIIGKPAHQQVNSSKAHSCFQTNKIVFIP